MTAPGPLPALLAFRALDSVAAAGAASVAAFARPADDAALREALLLQALDAPVACIVCAPDGRVSFWNAAASALFGRDPDTALGQPLCELAIPASAQAAFARLWQAALLGRSTQGAHAIRRLDGHESYGHWTITPVRERDDLPVAAITCLVWDLAELGEQMRADDETRRRLLAAQRLARLGSITWDMATGTARLHDDACDLLGYPRGTTMSLDQMLASVVEEDRERIVEAARAAVGTDAGEQQLCFHWRNGRGERMSLAAMLEFERSPEGRIVRVLSTVQDITATTAALQALAESQERLAWAQKAANLGDWEWDYDRKKARLSKESLRMLDKPLDWDPDEREFMDVLPASDRGRILEQFRTAIKQREPVLRYEYRLPAKDQGFHDIFATVNLEYHPDGRPRRAYGVIQEVTQLKAYERQLHELAFFDSLTQLPNRALFIDRFKQALSDANWHAQQLGVMMLDLDRFKQINDSLGHNVGDELLKQTGQRLQEALREYDTVARLGGDEFAIILPEVRHATDLAVIAGKVVNAFAQPFVLGEREVVVTASVGVAVFPSDGTEVEALLQYADAALYHAKERGRNAFQFYSRELTAHASERLGLENDLRKALDRGELELYYQPKVDLASGAIVGAEALMRWNQPQRGLVPPDRFIGIAEDTGLIVPMGAWAIRTACEAAVQWNAGRDQSLKIAVNLSPRQFATPGLVDTVLGELQRTGCDPDWIELEITESLLLDASGEVRGTLEALSQAGLSIAIDDFGTGYSALSYLTRFPVQTLKIDRSFVRGLPGDHGSSALVNAITSLAHTLYMSIVAEGVETEEQAAYLRTQGCQYAQGFLYSKPLRRADFEARLRADTTPA